MIERGGELKAIGEALRSAANGVFAACAEWRRTGDHHAFGEATGPPPDLMSETLERGVSCRDQKTARFRRRLWGHDYNRLWAFAWMDGVEPTNNIAERALRPAVTWRKRSLGTWSETGSRGVERLLTVMQSLRMQGRSVYGFLVETLTAVLAGRPPPRLAPA
ncbi:MAG: transposase [Planctomycetes bacterium]|nr:transposase [Planctomycetota bacterium]